MAIASAGIFFVAARSWQLLSGAISRTPDFADSIMSEAAQRFRDELQLLSRAQATWLGAALVFTVMYTMAMLFREPKLFEGYPEWQLWVLLTALGAAAAFASYRLVRTIVSWRHVRLLRDANLAIGHQLQSIASGHGRAYHDVRTSAGVIDHVLIGQAGIYAVHVIARRRSGGGQASLAAGEISFSTGGAPVAVADIVAAGRRLEEDFARLAGRAIRVRSVIAVPGWDIGEQSGNEHLLVNEHMLPMIRGWKDQNDYLVNEDLDVLQEALTRRCRLSAG
ncbi:MAG: hypothetical protein R3358_10110 [Woeseiaceae bacterium]|nr:hypothetical protein [Woeseiaceae bacterium]